MILRARLLVPMQGVPIEDGAVVVRSGKVEAVGRFSDLRRDHAGESVIDLGEQAVLPGLINAHCHLDYTGLRGMIPPPENGFAAWVSQINALKATLTDDDYLCAIEEGFAESKRWGVTTIFNLEAFPKLIRKPPIRTWWFFELLDIRDPSQAGALLEAAVQEWKENWLGGYGLCPHAPYTASPGLYRLCAEAGVPLTTHLAESADEAAMFREARGPLYDFLKKIGRPMDDCGQYSSFGNAVRKGLAGPGWLLTHANELEEEDFEWIAAHPGPWQFVHCPRSHRFFGHRPFPWERLQALGATISLGTDSLASNDDLNLFEELRAAQQSMPWLTSEQLMEAVTTAPAQAVGQGGKLGAITPGAVADLIALPFQERTDEVFDAVVANRHPVEWMMVEGEIL